MNLQSYNQQITYLISLRIKSILNEDDVLRKIDRIIR